MPTELYHANKGRRPFLWSEGLQTGDERVDRQHQEIYEALLGVSLLLKMPDVQAGYWLGMVRRRIEEYVLSHFHEEERLMARSGYPDIYAHQLAHRGFVDAFKEQQARIAQLATEAEKLAAAGELLRFLNEWFDEEVMGRDRDFVQFLKGGK
ncbi:MAG: hypothetical protein H7835_11200 [Magnetococcus sp. XQGC-1]